VSGHEARLEAFFDAMERNDLAAVREVVESVCAEDCTLDAAGSEMEGTYRGHGEIIGFFRTLLDGFEPRYENRRFDIYPNGTLVCRYDQVMRSRATGLELRFPACGVFTVGADGLFTSGRTVRGAAEVAAALAQTGEQLA
jgi:phage tail tape-measure protein